MTMTMSDEINNDGPTLDPTPVPKAKDADNPQAEGLASGLQPGGMIPAGGPGALVGSLGTGGGSNADVKTGDSDENAVEQQ
jgi:hypothetical protein